MVMANDKIRFVIQFGGKDLPGLLRTFTEPIKDQNYNIFDISLATGEERHTTFLACEPFEESPKNRWKALTELKKMLDDRVKKKYEDHYKNENMVAPVETDWNVEITLVDKPQSPSFSMYLSVLAQHKPNAIYTIAGLLQEAFNIKKSSDSPQLPRDGEDWNPDMLSYRVIWLTLEERVSKETDDLSNANPITLQASKLKKALKPNQESIAIERSEELIKEIAEELIKEIAGSIKNECGKNWNAKLWSAHVVAHEGCEKDGTVLTSRFPPKLKKKKKKKLKRLN
jgi:predicted amino acid-binding ACT domain protein